MDYDSYDIQRHSILTENQRRPNYLENCHLTDFATLIRIVYPANITLEDPHDDNIDDNLLEHENKHVQDAGNYRTIKWHCHQKKRKKRKSPRILIHVNCNMKLNRKPLQRIIYAISAM